MFQLRTFSRLTASLLALSLALVSIALTLPVRGAIPGAEILSFSGSLGGAVPSRTIILADSGTANMRLAVAGGAPGDLVTLELLDGSGNPVAGASWPARTGETVWAATTLPAGSRLRLSTASAGLSVDLKVYARGTILAPTEASAGLAGTLIGAEGATSPTRFELSVPTPGLYSFALGADSGAYQVVVADGYLRKTVVAGQAPAAADSTYYLPAGNLAFQIVADSTASTTTAWSLQLTKVGELDSLPYGEATARLGSTLGRGAFTEERVPIQVAAGSEVNLRISVTGAASDSLSVELFNGATAALTVAPVGGGETVWATGQLAAGANALRVVAPNTASATLAYTIEIVAIGQPDLTLAGASQGASAVNSKARVTFPADGLYRFNLAASAGRFQLRLNDTYLRRIVGGAGSDFTAFVPAGTHELVVDQETGAGATWSATIAAAGQAADGLPFTRAGATLGGASNDFVDERLPVALAADTPVNISITARGGDSDDKLRFEIIRPGAEPSFTIATIFGGDDPGEITWATTTMAAGASLLRVSAEGNTQPMAYDVTLSAVPSAPTSWAGISRGVGLSSSVTMNAPEDGIYAITLTLEVGAGQLLLDSVAPASLPRLAGASTPTVLQLRVPLSAGAHSLTLDHDRGQALTRWTVDAALLRPTPALTLRIEQPFLVVPQAGATLIVPGTGFTAESVVEIVDGSGSPLAATITVLSDTQIQVLVPAGAAPGTYTLRVRNSNGAEAEAAGAVIIGDAKLYLPLVRR